jgi:hypothetical protein
MMIFSSGVFRSKKDGVACLGEGPLPFATKEDAPFATLDQIGRDGAYSASVHQPTIDFIGNSVYSGKAELQQVERPPP